MRYFMIAVASHTAGQPHLGKRGLVRTSRKQLCLTNMAGTADIGHRCDSRRRSSVVAMTIIASWGRQILLLEQGFGVNALSVLRDLIRWDPVGLHIIGIAVTAPASLCHVGGEHRCGRVFNGFHTVI